MTPAEQLAQLRAEYEASTRTQWWKEPIQRQGAGRTLTPGYVVVCHDIDDAWRNRDHTLAVGTIADARHILSAHNAFPALLAIAEAARELYDATNAYVVASAIIPGEQTAWREFAQRELAMSNMAKALAALGES